MSFDATNLTRIHGTGDSIFAIATGVLGDCLFEPGGFNDQCRAAAGLTFTALPASRIYVPSKIGQNAPSSYSGAAPVVGRRQIVTRYGVGGRTVSALKTDLQASVFVWNPDLLIIEMGTNDKGGGTPVGPGSSFALDYESTVAQCLAWKASLKIFCLSIPVRVETIAAGHYTDGSDTWAGNTDIQTVCANHAANCEYVDLINPQLAFSIAHPPLNGNNQWTQDNIHPTKMGKVFIGAQIMKHLRFK